MEKVTVLLATYNGERYLSELLESLITQTYQNFEIVIHDDGSTDMTNFIVESYRTKYGEKIRVINDDVFFGDARLNFFHLLKFVETPYIMFCDQDDVWLPDKIELTIFRMRALENTYKNIPIVVHTDLRVVDERLQLIAHSMFKYQKLFKNQSLAETFVRNNVTGCTMMINIHAFHCINPMQSQAMMHDWWIALKVLANQGIVCFLDKPTILYRQHGRNNVGVCKFGLFRLIKRSRLFDSRRKIFFQKMVEQANQIDSSTTAFKLRLLQFKLALSVLFMKREQ